MKQLINTFFIVLIIANLSFSQTNNSTKPVKKVVTSKITKDPKTGKVVKTITTVTTTDVVLDPGRQVANSKPIVSQPVKKSNTTVKQPAKIVVKKTAVKPKPVVVAKKPLTQAKAIPVKPKPSVATKSEDNGSIFSNPADHSAKNVEKAPEDKSDINTPFKEAQVATKNNTPTEKPKEKAPTKTYKEKKYAKNSHGIFVGLRGGVNFAKVENVSSLTSFLSATENYKIGMNGGVFLNYAFNDFLSIQPEVNFSQQGYEISDGIDSEILNNQSINVPVLLKVAIGGSKIKAFVNAGPYAGYLLTSKKTHKFGSETVTNFIDFEQDSNNEITTNRIDYGLQGGAGFQINLGGPKLELEARYNYGLADPKLYSGTKPSYIGDAGRNRILTGTIGLMFPIGRK